MVTSSAKLSLLTALGFLTAAGADAQPRAPLPRRWRLCGAGTGAGAGTELGTATRDGTNCSPEVAAAGAAEQKAVALGKDSAETGERRQRSRNARRSSGPAGLAGLGPGPSPPPAPHSAPSKAGSKQGDPDSPRLGSSGEGGAARGPGGGKSGSAGRER